MVHKRLDARDVGAVVTVGVVIFVVATLAMLVVVTAVASRAGGRSFN